MAVKPVPQKWETTDGEEFDSEKQATAHQALIDARREYDNARWKLDTLLAESQKTADGVVFSFGLWTEYYFVTPGWGGMPALTKVGFYARNYTFEGDEDTLVLTQTGPRGAERFPIGELYAHKENANRAMVAAREVWVAERAAEVAELRAKVFPESAQP